MWNKELNRYLLGYIYKISILLVFTEYEKHFTLRKLRGGILHANWSMEHFPRSMFRGVFCAVVSFSGASKSLALKF